MITVAQILYYMQLLLWFFYLGTMEHLTYNPTDESILVSCALYLKCKFLVH